MQVFLKMRYDDLFYLHQSANFQIFDMDPNILNQSSIIVDDTYNGSTTTTIYNNLTFIAFQDPNTSVHIDYMRFELPAAFASSLQQNHQYHFTARIRLIVRTTQQGTALNSNTFFTPGSHELKTFRAGFGAILNNGTEYTSCDDFGVKFTILQPSIQVIVGNQKSSSCEPFKMSIQLQSKSGNFDDDRIDFPNEFRPYAGIDGAVEVNFLKVILYKVVHFYFQLIPLQLLVL